MSHIMRVKKKIILKARMSISSRSCTMQCQYCQELLPKIEVDGSGELKQPMFCADNVNMSSAECTYK